MKFSKKLLLPLLMVSGLATSVGVVHQAQASNHGSGSGTYSGALRVFGPYQLPNGDIVWSNVVTFVASTQFGCQAQMQPYLDTGAVVVRPCQQGMVNLDNVAKH